MASFSDTKITPANGQKIPTVDGSTTGYTETQDIKDYILEGKAQPNGIATLDENGKLPSTQLPDFANDVLSFDSYSLLPSVGADGVLYIVKDTNKLYRWDGTQYTNVNTDTTELEQRVDDLETEVEGLESDVDEHTDRLAQYDFSGVDPFEGFVLDGDKQQNFESMVQNSDVYEQDAIMLSLGPSVPTASTHNFGTRGQIAIDDAYLYVCVADNTWKKIPLQNL